MSANPEGARSRTSHFGNRAKLFLPIVISITDTQSATCNNFKRADVSAPKGGLPGTSETPIFQRSFSAIFQRSLTTQISQWIAHRAAHQSLESVRTIA